MKELKLDKKRIKSSLANAKKAKEPADKDINKADSKIKKSTSLRLEKKTLKALKIIAIEKETSLQSLIEAMIEAYLEEHKSTLK
jgi:predicted DNA-binding ribbon-helix-helix protein|tara:strand:- start:1494 stop:1745 length:252 start_codon:yes stop_codon:yes gene_type:complete